MPINSRDYSDRLDLLKAGHRVWYEVDFRDASVSVFLRPETETDIPLWIHHGHGLLDTIGWAQAIDATRLDELLAWITLELDVVVATYRTDWDGQNVRGRVDREALEALADTLEKGMAAIRLQHLNNNAGLWDAEEWLGPTSECIPKYGLSATSSDADLKAIAERIGAEAASFYMALIGLDEYLEFLRFTLQLRAAMSQKGG